MMAMDPGLHRGDGLSGDSECKFTTPQLGARLVSFFLLAFCPWSRTPKLRGDDGMRKR